MLANMRLLGTSHDRISGGTDKSGGLEPCGRTVTRRRERMMIIFNAKTGRVVVLANRGRDGNGKKLPGSVVIGSRSRRRE